MSTRRDERSSNKAKEVGSPEDCVEDDSSRSKLRSCSFFRSRGEGREEEGKEVGTGTGDKKVNPRTQHNA